jgi:hypothetical protein
MVTQVRAGGGTIPPHTIRGPFWQGEDIARERLHKKGPEYLQLEADAV